MHAPQFSPDFAKTRDRNQDTPGNAEDLLAADVEAAPVPSPCAVRAARTPIKCHAVWLAWRW
jgi:hypothetical protein